MKVKFTQPREIDGKVYHPGTHDLPASLKNHWYFKSIVADGTATIVDADSPDPETEAALQGSNSAGATNGQLTDTQVEAASKLNAAAAKDAGEELSTSQEAALNAEIPAPAEAANPDAQTNTPSPAVIELTEGLELEEGQLYTAEGNLFVGQTDEATGDVGLLPLEQTTQAERDELVADGMITAEQAASLPAPAGDQHANAEKPLTKAQQKAKDKADAAAAEAAKANAAK